MRQCRLVGFWPYRCPATNQYACMHGILVLTLHMLPRLWLLSGYSWV